MVALLGQARQSTHPQGRWSSKASLTAWEPGTTTVILARCTFSTAQQILSLKTELSPLLATSSPPLFTWEKLLSSTPWDTTSLQERRSLVARSSFPEIFTH